MMERGSFDPRSQPPKSQDSGRAGKGFTFLLTLGCVLPKKTWNPLMSPLPCWIYWLEPFLWGLPGVKSFPRFPCFEGWLNIRDDSAEDESDPSLHEEGLWSIGDDLDALNKREKLPKCSFQPGESQQQHSHGIWLWMTTTLGFIGIFLLGKNALWLKREQESHLSTGIFLTGKVMPSF